jgi:hypothetical protein
MGIREWVPSDIHSLRATRAAAYEMRDGEARRGRAAGSRDATSARPIVVVEW